MTFGKSINRLRSDANLSQEQFAQIFDVSQQSVHKWESDIATPSIEKIIQISKYFGVSLDALILGNDKRMTEEMRGTEKIKPQYETAHAWEFYPSALITEYKQSTEEGLDIGKYKDLFHTIARLPKDEIAERLGDVLFTIVQSADTRKEYSYIEPSDLDSIRLLRKPYSYRKSATPDRESQIQGAWMGRICGCLLGKTVECIHSDELIPFLKKTNNYPMHRYILSSDLEKVDLNEYKFPFASTCYADTCNGMPADDDTNYMVLYQEIIEKYGKDFTPFDVSRAWLNYQPINAYCSAERVAYINFVKGYVPPMSAQYKNPYREWIGAQIRGDYFGYINPGNPELAAEMAWRDASISHTKNGIYGEMFISAMLAVAAETNNIEEIILGGLAQVPHTSRLYQSITSVLDGFKNGVTQADCFQNIHEQYDEHTSHGWCHTIPNAMIVVASLLYGKGDYSKSICMAVETAFDTDCNGATVGSILGMANGIESIPEYWVKPINDTLHTSIFGINKVKISDRAKLTLDHIK